MVQHIQDNQMAATGPLIQQTGGIKGPLRIVNYEQNEDASLCVSSETFSTTVTISGQEGGLTALHRLTRSVLS